MANKSVPGYTQVPIVAANLQVIRYDRLNDSGTQCNLTVTYEVKDDVGAVRLIKQHNQQVGAYPVTVGAILSAINTVEGT